MSTKTNASQAQHSAPSFDPVLPFVLSLDAWSKLAQDNVARVQSFYDELAGMESHAYDRAKKTASDFAEILGETMSYYKSIATEWQKLTLEATRRGAEIFTKA